MMEKFAGFTQKKGWRVVAFLLMLLAILGILYRPEMEAFLFVGVGMTTISYLLDKKVARWNAYTLTVFVIFLLVVVAWDSLVDFYN